MDLLFKKGKEAKRERTLKEQLEDTKKDIMNMKSFQPKLVEILNQQGDKLFMEDNIFMEDSIY